jgi:hypothetical protein
LGRVFVAVDYDNRSTPRRFDVTVELGGEMSEKQLSRLEKVARSCPVRRSIETGIEFSETISRRAHRPAERALTRSPLNPLAPRLEVEPQRKEQS